MNEPPCLATHPEHPGTHCRRAPGHNGAHMTARRDVEWDNAYLSAPGTPTDDEPVDECDHPWKPCVKWAGHHDPCDIRWYGVLLPAAPASDQQVSGTPTVGRALLARHIDCSGVCDVWVERDAILAIEDEMTRLRQIEKAARAFVDWYDGPPYVYAEPEIVAHVATLRDALDRKVPA